MKDDPELPFVHRLDDQDTFLLGLLAGHAQIRIVRLRRKDEAGEELTAPERDEIERLIAFQAAIMNLYF